MNASGRARRLTHGRTLSVGRMTEILANRLALAPQTHKYWDSQFFWLPQNSVGEAKMWEPPSLPSSCDSTGDNILLFDNIHRTVIESGHVITFQTDNPVGKPLPSWDLLQMQWMLHGVAALRGVEDDDIDGDDGDDDF